MRKKKTLIFLTLLVFGLSSLMASAGASRSAGSRGGHGGYRSGGHSFGGHSNGGRSNGGARSHHAGGSHSIEHTHTISRDNVSHSGSTSSGNGSFEHTGETTFTKDGDNSIYSHQGTTLIHSNGDGSKSIDHTGNYTRGSAYHSGYTSVGKGSFEHTGQTSVTKENGSINAHQGTTLIHNGNGSKSMDHTGNTNKNVLNQKGVSSFSHTGYIKANKNASEGEFEHTSMTYQSNEATFSRQADTSIVMTDYAKNISHYGTTAKRYAPDSSGYGYSHNGYFSVEHSSSSTTVKHEATMYGETQDAASWSRYVNLSAYISDNGKNRNVDRDVFITKK